MTSDVPPTRSRRRPDGSFRNNYPYDARGVGSYLNVVGDYVRMDRRPPALPLVSNDPAYLRANRSEPTLTWIGHDTFLLQLGGMNILTDPHFTNRASPLRFAGPMRFTPPGLRMEDLPHIDLVLLSHNHYDHLDERSVVRLARQSGGSPHFFVPLGVKKWFQRRRIKAVTELDWWASADSAPFRFHCVPVQHFSGRTLADRNHSLWCGWVGLLDGFQFFFAGDSGYSKDFGDIHERFGAMDLSLIPIGAYEPRWFMQTMHVNPEEAMQIHRDLHSRHSVGMHWGTFRLTTEPVDEPPQRLASAMAAAGVPPEDFAVYQHGESRSLKFLFERAERKTATR